MRKPITIVIIIGAFILLIFLDTRGFLGGVTDIAYRAVSPVVKFSNKAVENVTAFFILPFFYNRLLETNTRLAIENETIKEELIQLREVERENRIFREFFETGKHKEFDLASAQIIHKDSIVPGDYFVIDGGLSRGIKNGMPAITQTSNFIGVVVEAQKNFSRIRLVTDSASVISALSQISRTTGTVKGELGTSISFYFEGSPDDIEKGEAIITSGFDSGIPKGLVLGEVESIQETPDRANSLARVSTSSDIKNLEEVFIITNTL